MTKTPTIADLQAMVHQPVAREASFRDKVLTKQPTTLMEFHTWIVVGLGPIIDPNGLKFPMDALNEDSTSSIRWMYELYHTACGRKADWSVRLPEEHANDSTDFVIKSYRAGSKTLGIALVEWTLCQWNDWYGVGHTAAIEYQAQRALEYCGRRLAPAPEFSHVVKRALKSVIEFKNNSEIAIAIGTISGQNSRHPQFKSYDEADLMNYNVLSEGDMAAISRTRPDGHVLPPVTACLSTQKEALATMYMLIEECTQGTRHLRQSNLMDGIETCRPKRFEKLTPHGIRCEDWDAINERLSILERKGHKSKDDIGDVLTLQKTRSLLTDNCKLVEYCQGLAKNGSGHYSINDAIAKLKDKSKFEAQLMCLQPDMKHAVYPTFSNKNVSKEAIYRSGCPVIAPVDYGFTADPSCLMLWNVFDPYIDQFAELKLEHVPPGRQPARFLGLLKKFDIDPREVIWVPDPNAKELIYAMENHGMKCEPPRGKRARQIDFGIDRLAELIYDDGFRRWRINPLCTWTIQAMFKYKKKPSGAPADNQDDHPCDTARYGAVHLRKRRQSHSSIIQSGRPAGTTTIQR